MSIKLHLRMLAYALALVGMWAVTFTERFSLVWPLASTLLVLLAWFYEGPSAYQVSYRRIWMTFGALMLVFFPFDIYLSRSLLVPAVHVTLFIQAYTLLNRKSWTSYRRILIVSFVQVLASTNLTSDLRFAFIIIAYFSLAGYFVLLLHMQRRMQAVEGPAGGEQEQAPQGLLVFSVALAFAMLPLSLTFFYGMPRLRYALIARGNPIDSLNQMMEARQRTGFTRTVELGAYGPVQEDETLALRVEIPSARGRPLDRNFKWRGGALNIYDGASWGTSRDYFKYFNGKQWVVTKRNIGLIFPRRKNLFILDEPYSDYRSQKQLDADPTLLKQVFYLEIPYSESLFGAGELKAVEGPFTYGIGCDFNESYYISNRQAIPDLISYTAYSFVDEPSATQLRGVTQEDFRRFLEEENYSPYVRKAFLQLPTSLKPEIKQLALEITRGSATPYDKITAIRNYLENRYTYSLNLSKRMTDDPLYDFLFVSRSGHCEYFATAMAIMCRTVGYPTRLVRGFQQGEWNDSGNFYEVRQKDSHAWVEVYFPNFGWISFDPSPRASADEYFESRRTRIGRYLSKRLLQLQILWRQNVVGYNETRRLRLFSEIGSSLHAAPATVAKVVRGVGQSAQRLGGLRTGAILLLLLVAPFLLRFAGKIEARLPQKLRFLQTTRRSYNGAAFYGKMLRLLEKRKIVKPSNLTPREFLDLPRLQEHPMRAELNELTSLYYDVRYGGHQLEAEEFAIIQNTLTELRRTNGQTEK